MLDAPARCWLSAILEHVPYSIWTWNGGGFHGPVPSVTLLGICQPLDQDFYLAAFVAGYQWFLLGGAKKKSIAQMEKQQVQQDAAKKPEPAKKSKGKTVAEKKTAGIGLPNFEDAKFTGELSKMGALTPYAIASQFNVRISVARDILEELERRRMVKSVGGNARIKVYKLAAA